MNLFGISGAPKAEMNTAMEQGAESKAHCILLGREEMFDEADLITLPRLGQGACYGVSRKAATSESFPAAAGNETAPTLNQNTCHVIEACAMAGEDVALAMSDGKLCHAKLSQTRATAAKLVPTEENKRWPLWASWPSRHGKVDSLQYDPAHDALVTIEVKSTVLAASIVAGFLI